MLSFGSHKSRDSVPKIDMTETDRDKNARRIKGKADPSVAIKEVEPSVRAQEQSTMKPIRAIQHRDSTGNVITDPDRSNPTRPRMERPLDTIRSFEAAIDGGYNKRFSMQPDMQSRRSSYYQGITNPQRSSAPPDAFFNRSSASRPASVYGEPQQGGYYGSPQQRRYPPRNNSDPMLYGNNGYGMQPQHPHQQSYDTATASTSNSYNTDGASTDPSSHNSSLGELPQMPKPVPEETYGMNFGGVPPIMEDEYGQPLPGYANGLNRNRGNQNQEMPPPPPPAHGNGMGARQPISLGNTASPSDYSSPPPAARPVQEKRRSWLGRRFSRNGN